MILSKGKLRFIRLRIEDLELVRKWRNSPSINRYMEYRGYISEEEQLKWYNSINNINNFYFLIEYEHQKIGLVNAKEINWDDGTTEGGVFFWEEQYYNSPLPVITFMVLADILVKGFELKLYGHILRSNHRAIRYNTLLGFNLCEDQEDIENQLYVLTRESYMSKGSKIRSAFNLIVDKSPLILHFTKQEALEGLEEKVRSKLNPEVIEDISSSGSGIDIVFNI